MSDRDRLIELVGTVQSIGVKYTHEETASSMGFRENEKLADHLLANGVILPLCKVGDTVYTRYGYSFKIEKIEVLEDRKIIFRCGNDGTDDYMAFYDFEIGTDVFLTEQEAREALKGGAKE